MTLNISLSLVVAVALVVAVVLVDIELTQVMQLQHNPIQYQLVQGVQVVRVQVMGILQLLTL